ncbi:hypothetical protein V6N13_144988 [Hibiscus sabdariffa]|uniref:Uncharacterized protein n=1 Tax=Hibiscus sabdariffa TaxID=183260 RepID=A0ABR1ZPJ3_9ROSI
MYSSRPADEGLANLSDTDCGSNDPDLKQEMEKQFLDLLTEELKLEEAVAEEHARDMNITFGEAKRVGFSAQKGSQKNASLPRKPVREQENRPRLC